MLECNADGPTPQDAGECMGCLFLCLRLSVVLMAHPPGCKSVQDLVNTAPPLPQTTHDAGDAGFRHK